MNIYRPLILVKLNSNKLLYTIKVYFIYIYIYIYIGDLLKFTSVLLFNKNSKCDEICG